MVDRSFHPVLDQYFPVLDYGFVALVDVMGDDSAIEQAARVSYGRGTRKATETRSLIRYLSRHRHSTPTEMVEFKFHIAMPIFVMRQHIRHRTASTNEYSGRYSIMPSLFYMPDIDHFCEQSKDNKQGRSNKKLIELYTATTESWHSDRRRTAGLYDWLCENGVARELARIDLPLSTYTQFYWKIDLHNLFHYLSLRCDSHAQWEIRQYALLIAKMVKRIAPYAFEAWFDFHFTAQTFSRQEMAVLRRLVAREESGLRARGGAVLADDLQKTGLSGREVTELLQKFDAPTTSLEDFDLLTDGFPASHFQTLWEQN